MAAAKSAYNNNTNFLVKNLRGTADSKCPECTSWLDHWDKWTANKSWQVCANVEDCEGKDKSDLVGAHVQVEDNRSSGVWWIVPLCRSCNSRKGNALPVINAKCCIVRATACTTLKAGDLAAKSKTGLTSYVSDDESSSESEDD